jgi:hypothetical protein
MTSSSWLAWGQRPRRAWELPREMRVASAIEVVGAATGVAMGCRCGGRGRGRCRAEDAGAIVQGEGGGDNDFSHSLMGSAGRGGVRNGIVLGGICSRCDWL